MTAASLLFAAWASLGGAPSPVPPPSASAAPPPSPKACLQPPPTSDDPGRVDRAHNARGAALQACSTDPMTGFFRDGYCVTGPEDRGTHVVCAKMTAEFLEFTKSRGNDLSSAAPRYRFPGLRPGDRWCLCALRWREAAEAGRAPPVVLEATEASALRYVDSARLEAAALDR